MFGESAEMDKNGLINNYLRLARKNLEEGISPESYLHKVQELDPNCPEIVGIRNSWAQIKAGIQNHLDQEKRDSEIAKRYDPKRFLSTELPKVSDDSDQILDLMKDEQFSDHAERFVQEFCNEYLGMVGKYVSRFDELNSKVRMRTKRKESGYKKRSDNTATNGEIEELYKLAAKMANTGIVPAGNLYRILATPELSKYIGEDKKVELIKAYYSVRNRVQNNDGYPKSFYTYSHSADSFLLMTPYGIESGVTFRFTNYKTDYKTEFQELTRNLSSVSESLQAEIKKSNSGCYIATAVYGSYNCPEVWTLRRYRDYTLAETWYGRAFIHFYYAVSPTIVKWFGKYQWFDDMWKPVLDIMVLSLKSKGYKDSPYNDKNW